MTALILVLFLLAGCDQRPAVRLEAGPGVPPAPTDAAFALLPSDGEVVATAKAQYQYWKGLRVDLPRLSEGLVRWERDDDGPAHYWTYQPPLRVYGELVEAVRYPEAVKKLTGPLRWQYRDGAWQQDQLFSAYRTGYRGVPEPGAAQVMALLQQPGIGYILHRMAAVPTEIRLDGEPRWPRDDEGFAQLRAPVEFTAMVPLLDQAAGMLQNHEVRLRAYVRLDTSRERWSIEEEVEMLSSRFRFSTPTDDARQWQMRNEMDRFWKAGR